MYALARLAYYIMSHRECPADVAFMDHVEADLWRLFPKLPVVEQEFPGAKAFLEKCVVNRVSTAELLDNDHLMLLARQDPTTDAHLLDGW